jgi:hypothetical protein
MGASPIVGRLGLRTRRENVLVTPLLEVHQAFHDATSPPLKSLGPCYRRTPGSTRPIPTKNIFLSCTCSQRGLCGEIQGSPHTGMEWGSMNLGSTRRTMNSATSDHSPPRGRITSAGYLDVSSALRIAATTRNLIGVLSLQQNAWRSRPKPFPIGGGSPAVEHMTLVVEGRRTVWNKGRRHLAENGARDYGFSHRSTE